MLPQNHLQSTVGFPAPLEQDGVGELVDFALGLGERSGRLVLMDSLKVLTNT